MGRIYRGQSALRIRIQTGSDLSQMTEGKICYINPGSETGIFPVIKEDSSDGILFYDVQEGDLEQAGWWLFWVEVIFQDGRKGIGEKRKVYIWG